MRLTVAPTAAVVLAGTMAASSVIAPWPALRNGVARLVGDPRVYAVSAGYEEWAQRTLWLGLFLVVATFVLPVNRWLAGAVALLGCHVFLRSTASIGHPGYAWVALVALGLACLAMAPEAHGFATRMLVGIAVVQAAYILLQWGGTDLLLGPAQRALVGGRPGGTLGNAGPVGALLALAAPFAPWWALALIVPATIATFSLGPCLALVVGLALRFRSRIPVQIGAAVLALLLLHRGFDSLKLRAQTVYAGALDLIGSASLFGFGLRGWRERMPASVVKDGTYPTAWYTAHNDPFQWTYDTGALGLVLLVGFVWSTRRAVLSPSYGAAYAALMIVSLLGSPFHAVTPGLAGALILGLVSTTTTQTGA